MNDQYSWWRKALEMSRGRELTREQQQELGVSETDPQSGFFRTRKFKDGPLVPVAIWRDENGALFCVLDGAVADAERIWTYASRNPISEQNYKSVIAGEAWPDDPPSIPKDHNQQAKTGDPLIDLQREFDAERELADDFLKRAITTQEQADQAAIWSKRIAAIAKKATDLHRVEKQPSLDESRRIDDKWRDLKEKPAALAKDLKRHMDAFLNEQHRLEQERQRKAREEAEKIRRQAEEAARKAEETQRRIEAEKAKAAESGDGGSVSLFGEETNAEADRMEAERLKEQAEKAEREAEARNATAGRTGSRVALRTYYVGQIDDYDAALNALKDEPEVREIIAKIVNRLAATKGATMPAGTARIEEKRAA